MIVNTEIKDTKAVAKMAINMWPAYTIDEGNRIICFIKTSVAFATEVFIWACILCLRLDATVENGH